MKTVLFIIFIFLFPNINNAQMNTKVIRSKEALDLIKSKKLVELETIDYNLCSVFKIDSQKYLIRPINPFADALIIDSFKQIDSFIKEGYFPDDDEQNTLYALNRAHFEQRDFHEFKNEKINELKEYLQKSNSKYVNGIDMNNADSIYKALSKTKTIKKYKLGFVFFVGEQIIQDHHPDLKWCIVQTKVKLNPERELALYDSNNEYFDLEFDIFGKWGYINFYSILSSIKRFRLSVKPPITEFYQKY